MNAGTIERQASVALHAPLSERISKWAREPRLDSSTIQEALDEVRADYQLTPPLSSTFRCEYFLAMGLFDEGLAFDDNSPVELFLRNEPEVSRRIVKLAYANWLPRIDLPVHRTRRRSGELGLFESVDGVSVTSNEAAEHLERRFEEALIADRPIVRGMRVWAIRERARQSLMEVALAAQAYFRDHERFPETYEALLDGYLSEWPTDPYARTEQALSYRVDLTANAVVWSVGPNRVDDGANLNVSYYAPDFDLGMEILRPEVFDGTVDGEATEPR